jgi:hypothetical protein
MESGKLGTQKRERDCDTSSHCVHYFAKLHSKIAFMKVKGKVSLYITKYHAMKRYWGSGWVAPRIIDLDTR